MGCRLVAASRLQGAKKKKTAARASHCLGDAMHEPREVGGERGNTDTLGEESGRVGTRAHAD